jgi:hypothetical protein
MKHFLQKNIATITDQQDKFYQTIYFKYVRKDSTFFSVAQVKSRSGVCMGEEQQKVFDNIKEYLISSLVLIPPWKGKSFKLYLLADDQSIGSVLILEFEGK